MGQFRKRKNTEKCYSGYSFQKHCPQKVATVTDFSFFCLNSIFLFSSGMTQDHGRLSVEHISKPSHKNLRTCWTPWSALSIQWLETSQVATKHTVKHCLTNTTSNFEAFECDLAHGSFTAFALQFTASGNYLECCFVHDGSLQKNEICNRK